ncbi:flagellar biosynthesis protein FlgA, partial [Rhizobium ruizarguesonis]
RHARIAIDAGKHVALVSIEVDSVFGRGLSLRARRNYVIVTPVDGDQPRLLMGLITWAEVLGLDIVSAGKASEYDIV